MQLTTLIPAFNPQYLQELLIAVGSQVRKPDLIIISDDSRNNDFLSALGQKKMQRLAQGLNIETSEGPKKGQYANFRHLVSKLTDDDTHFHLLCDDDIIYPDFYKRHLQAHTSSAALATFSRRWIAVESGQPESAANYPAAIADSANKFVLVNDDYLFKTTLPVMNNWLGEFSNTVFKKDARDLFLDPRLNGVCHYGLYDLGIYLRSARSHGCLLINEHLGAFRRNPSQHSSQTQSPTFRCSVVAWVALSIAASQQDKISEADLVTTAKRVFSILKKYFAQDPKVQRVLALEVLIDQRRTEAFASQFLDILPAFQDHIDPALF